MIKFFLFLFFIALVFRAFFALFGVSLVKLFAREINNNARKEYQSRQQQTYTGNTYTPPPVNNSGNSRSNKIEDIDFEEIK